MLCNLMKNCAKKYSHSVHFPAILFLYTVISWNKDHDPGVGLMDEDVRKGADQDVIRNEAEEPA